MSVMMHGKDLPNNCFTDDCPCLDGENGRCQADAERRYVYGDRPYWCPFSQVPSDHGDLVDRDVLKMNLGVLYDACNGRVNWNDAICELLSAPVVIGKEGKL